MHSGLRRAYEQNYNQTETVRLSAAVHLPAYAVAAGHSRPLQDLLCLRVAWYPNSAYNITCENGERSGYGYEYQQSVAAYTGWTYHYIEANWPDSPRTCCKRAKST